MQQNAATVATERYSDVRHSHNCDLPQLAHNLKMKENVQDRTD